MIMRLFRALKNKKEKIKVISFINKKDVDWIREIASKIEKNQKK